MKRVQYLACTALLGMSGGVTLASDDACMAVEKRQFDFWVGAWEVVNLQRNPGNPADPGFYPTGVADGIVYPVAGGCAIAEQWEGELSWGKVLGFSLRTYDTVNDEWTLLLNWPAPGAASPGPYSQLRGGFHHGRGEFFSSVTGADGSTTDSRFTFSDISADRYRWDSALSTDGGVSWATNWKMEATRKRQANGEAIMPGPESSANYTACADDPGSQSLRMLDGRWSGRTATGIVVEFEAMPIMEGCAVIEMLSIGESAAWNEFRVRAFQPASSEWLQYSVSNRGAGLAESTGMPADGQLTWISGKSEKVVERWRIDDEKHLYLEQKQLGGETLQVELNRRP